MSWRGLCWRLERCGRLLQRHGGPATWPSSAPGWDQRGRRGLLLVPTPLTYVATASAVRCVRRRAGLRRQRPAHLEPTSIRPTSSARSPPAPKAVVPAPPLYGKPAAMDEVEGIARRHGLPGDPEGRRRAIHGASLPRPPGRLSSGEIKAAFSFFGDTRSSPACGEGDEGRDLQTPTWARKMRQLVRGRGGISRRRYWFPVVWLQLPHDQHPGRLSGAAQLERIARRLPRGAGRDRGLVTAPSSTEHPQLALPVRESRLTNGASTGCSAWCSEGASGASEETR